MDDTSQSCEDDATGGAKIDVLNTRFENNSAVVLYPLSMALPYKFKVREALLERDIDDALVSRNSDSGIKSIAFSLSLHASSVNLFSRLANYFPELLRVPTYDKFQFELY